MHKPFYATVGQIQTKLAYTSDGSKNLHQFFILDMHGKPQYLLRECTNLAPTN